MAIDTALKRASVILPRLPWQPLPPPDGSVDIGDRASLTWMYAAIYLFDLFPGDSTFSQDGVGDTTLAAQYVGDSTQAAQYVGDSTLAAQEVGDTTITRQGVGNTTFTVKAT